MFLLHQKCEKNKTIRQKNEATALVWKVINPFSENNLAFKLIYAF